MTQKSVRPSEDLSAFRTGIRLPLAATSASHGLICVSVFIVGAAEGFWQPLEHLARQPRFALALPFVAPLVCVRDKPWPKGFINKCTSAETSGIIRLTLGPSSL